MIFFPGIWWLFPAISLTYILLSWFLTRSGKLQNTAVRKIFVSTGVMLGFFTFVLPIFEQPVFKLHLVQLGLGIPLLVAGFLGRIYPMIYLRKKGTTTTLNKVHKLVDTGPYAWVRHPQYTAGMVMLLAWFLVWGSLYALCVLPLMAAIIYAQAYIEEKYILEKMFGETYAAYRKRVGMLLPRMRPDRKRMEG